MDNLTQRDYLDMLGFALSEEHCIICSYETYDNIYQQSLRNTSGHKINVKNHTLVCGLIQFCGEIQLQAAMHNKFGYFSDLLSCENTSQVQEQSSSVDNEAPPSVDDWEPHILVKFRCVKEKGDYITVSLHIQQSVDVTLGTGASKIKIKTLYYNYETVGSVVQRVVQNFREKTKTKDLQGYLQKDRTVLQDKRSMEYYDIMDNTELQLVPKLLGGDPRATVVNFLKADSLSPRHNFNYTYVRDGANFGNRGGVPYHVPSGWMGIALDINKYPRNDWLGMSNQEGEWAVVYHGTTYKNVQEITDDGLRPGPHNAYGKGVLSGENKAIYCSPYVSTAAGYSNPPFHHQESGQSYYTVFQCRIDHSQSREHFQQPLNYIWLCKPGIIRPYRLLYKSSPSPPQQQQQQQQPPPPQQQQQQQPIRRTFLCEIM